jgi:hypothetical protein
MTRTVTLILSCAILVWACNANVSVVGRSAGGSAGHPTSDVSSNGGSTTTMNLAHGGSASSESSVATTAESGAGGGNYDCSMGVEEPWKQCMEVCPAEWSLCAYYSTCTDSGEPLTGCIALAHCAFEQCGCDVTCEACSVYYDDPESAAVVATQPLINCMKNCGQCL